MAVQVTMVKTVGVVIVRACLSWVQVKQRVEGTQLFRNLKRIEHCIKKILGVAKSSVALPLAKAQNIRFKSSYRPVRKEFIFSIEK